MPTIAGTVISGGVAQNGVTVSAYKASRFPSTQPIYDNPNPPPASPDASVTSGQGFGGDGAYKIAWPFNEDAWVAAVIGAHTAWAYWYVGEPAVQIHEGSLLVGKASDAPPAELPIGSSGQVLGVVSGEPAWVTPSDTDTLASDTDVVLSSPANNDVLTYETSSSKWKNKPPTGTDPTTTKGDLFGHSTVAARVPVGTDGQVLTADSTQALGVKWAAGGGGGGGAIGVQGRLARLAYSPTTLANYSTTSDSYTAADGTNLSISFTAPPSGVVEFRLSAVAYGLTNEIYLMWAVGPHGGSRDANTKMAVTSLDPAGHSKTRVAASCIVSGLTPGTSYVYDWFFAAGCPGFTVGFVAGGPDNDGLSSGSSSGPGVAPAVMEVWDGGIGAGYGPPAGDTAWTALTLGSSWVAYGSPYPGAQFRKSAEGFVYLDGLIKSGTFNTTVGTLPVGYRPAAGTQFIVPAGGGTAILDLQPNGVITLYTHISSSNASVSLECSFLEANATGQVATPTNNVYVVKPTDGITVSTWGNSFSTPWKKTVITDGVQSVRIRVTAAYHCGDDSLANLGIMRDGTGDANVIFATGGLYSAADGTRIQTASFEWVDDTPSAGSHTYEITGTRSGNAGTLTVRQGKNANNPPTLTDRANSCMTVELFVAS